MISAGEASGDLHAGALTRELYKLSTEVEVFGMGGECMRDAGAQVVFDIKEHGVMGLVEIIQKLPALFALKKAMGKLMDERKPDCVVTIDYSEFNTYVVASMAYERNIPVVSFIPPSVAVWRKNRAKYLSQKSSWVATIFPHENDIYLEAGAKAQYVGHPLLDVVKPKLTDEQARAKAGKNEGIPLILLMPGSRAQEIKYLLPIILQAAVIIKNKLPEVNFCMPCAPTVSKKELLEQISQYDLEVRVTELDVYDIMKVSDIAIAKSGTGTLEAALCGLPCVIVYKTSWLNEFIFRNILRLSVPNFGLPNIVMGRRIMPELLQEQVTPENIAQESLKLLQEPEFSKAKQELSIMREKMGGGGAIGKVAEGILRLVAKGENKTALQHNDR